MSESICEDVIAEFDDEIKALATLAALRGEGVEAALASEEKLRILVPFDKKAEALAVLESFESPLVEDWEQEAEALDGWLCHNCDTVMANDLPACSECGSLRSEQPPEDSD